MTSNFTETSISRNAKREYTPISTLETFTTAVQKFVDDTTMSFTKKEAGAATYKAKIVYFDVDGNEKGYVNYYAEDTTTYEDMTTYLKENAAEVAAGVDGVGTRNSADDTWSVKYSCAIGEDTFSVTITREYMLISGFEQDTTLSAIETWADTVAEFGETA